MQCDVRKGHRKDSEPQLIVIIPAFNEELYIGSVVLKALRYSKSVIVVDDGSVDDSRNVAEAAGARVLVHTTNKGKGDALNTGLNAARKLDPDVVVFLDGDGQHDPKHIPQLVKPIYEQRADIVTGSRFLDRPNRAPAYRRLGQRVVTLCTNLLSGLHVSDSWSGYRALSRRAVGLIRFSETGWGIEPELQFQALAHGLEMIDVPVDIGYHEGAKRNPVMQGTQTLTGVLRLVRKYRPLLVFWGFGLASLIAGLLVGLWVVHYFFATGGNLPFGVALISITLVILGMLTVYSALTLTYIREVILKTQNMDHPDTSSHSSSDGIHKVVDSS